MTDLPKLGDRVKVWPAGGRKIQASMVPFDDGGAALPAEGKEVEWSLFTYRQLLHGDLYLHDPSPAPADEKGA